LLDENLDKLYERLGGFGRYQLFLSITYVFLNKSIMIMVLVLSFLTKVPREYYCTYEGSEETSICKPADFCQDDTVTSFEPNMDLPDSYNNWILKFDLTCASKMKIGMIAASPFVGWVTTLLFIPRLADVYGRYKMMFAGNLVTWSAFSLLIFTDSYHLLITGLFIMGMMSTIRVQVGVLYLYECLTRANYHKIYTIVAILEGVFGVMGALYFKYVSKDWFYILMCGFIL